MRGNRKSDTRPEIRLRSALQRRGLRFRKNYPVTAGSLRTRPDIVFPRAKVAVFVDGCFWHSCPEHGTQPKSNAAYWIEKLARNRSRDAEVDQALQNSGWACVRVWEHESVEVAGERIESIVQARP